VDGEKPLRAVAMRSALRKTAINAAIDDFENRAICGTIKRSVHVRVAEHAGETFIDLCNDDWQAVRVTSAGWSIVESPPVRFVRTDGMLPLPLPQRGGSVEALQQFLNVADMDSPLTVAHLLAYLRPRGPYPILDALGPPGAAKTRLLRLMRRLVDPHAVETTPPPISGEDLIIAAGNSHVQAFENVSAMSPKMSDNYCRLATGGGMRTRKRFTNTRETLFRGARPIMIEGIYNIMKRPDILDRSTVFEVQRIADYESEEEQDLEFDRQRPAIFGALLDMLVHGLQMRPTTRLTLPRPRMVDFALWAVACGIDGFEQAYADNRQRAIYVLLEYDPLASAVRKLMAHRKQWHGTAKKLLDEIGPVTDIRSPQKLSDDLRMRRRSWRRSAFTSSMGSGRRASGRSRLSAGSDFRSGGGASSASSPAPPGYSSHLFHTAKRKADFTGLFSASFPLCRQDRCRGPNPCCR
jgi:hypothetical protein